MDVVGRFKKLIFGFTRLAEKECSLSMNVEAGIIEMIYTYYPKIYPFEFYDEEMFYVNDDGTELKGQDDKECRSCSVYAASPNGKGFNSGVHYWSLQNILKQLDFDDNEDEYAGDHYCVHSIGIRSKKYESDLTNISGAWIRDADTKYEYHSYIEGDDNGHWYYQQIYTIKLDCNEWTVTYFKSNSILKQKKLK